MQTLHIQEDVYGEILSQIDALCDRYPQRVLVERGDMELRLTVTIYHGCMELLADWDVPPYTSVDVDDVECVVFDEDAGTATVVECDLDVDRLTRDIVGNT